MDFAPPEGRRSAGPSGRRRSACASGATRHGTLYLNICIYIYTYTHYIILLYHYIRRCPISACASGATRHYYYYYSMTISIILPYISLSLYIYIYIYYTCITYSYIMECLRIWGNEA